MNKNEILMIWRQFFFEINDQICSGPEIKKI